MKLENDKCKIEISVDHTYRIGSADNMPYDKIYYSKDYTEKDEDYYYKTMSLQVEICSEKYSVALIGDCYSQDEDCAVLENEILTILMNDVVVRINISNGELIQLVKTDLFGCGFGFYRAKDGYIIYGELEIMMIDHELHKLWSFLGCDIFVSVTGKNPFQMFEDHISLYDFNDHYYEIDYNGVLIKELKPGNCDV